MLLDFVSGTGGGGGRGPTSVTDGTFLSSFFSFFFFSFVLSFLFVLLFFSPTKADLGDELEDSTKHFSIWTSQLLKSICIKCAIHDVSVNDSHCKTTKYQCNRRGQSYYGPWGIWVSLNMIFFQLRQQKKPVLQTY